MRASTVARQEQIDFLVGLGGGSSMDTAKGCNFLLTNGGRMEDYWGVGKATRPMLPLIAIPTTAGTGSECQSFALIAHPQTHVKMACGDPKAAARVAILDPELTLTQPPAVAAATGMDALSHALETAVTRRRNPISQMLSREAFRLCVRGLRRVFEHPQDVEGPRADVLLGAALAGMAIENSMLGAAHAAANPLTARFGVIHGHAVGLMLPAVVRFNAQDPEVAPLYHQLALQGGLIEPAIRQRHAGRGEDCPVSPQLSAGGRTAAIAFRHRGIRRRYRTSGRGRRQAMDGTFNPRPVSEQEFAELYREVLTDRDAAEGSRSSIMIESTVEELSPESQAKTTAGNYFVGNYPPFSFWNAAGRRAGPGRDRPAADRRHADGHLRPLALLPPPLPFLLLPRLHRPRRPARSRDPVPRRRAPGSGPV